MTRRDGFLTEHDLRSGLREQYIVHRPSLTVPAAGGGTVTNRPAVIKIELVWARGHGFAVSQTITYTDTSDTLTTVVNYAHLDEARNRFTRAVRTAPHVSLEGTHHHDNERHA